MDSTVKDITQIRVPPPDEALQKAFAELDACLASWKTALGGLRAELQEQARTQAEAHQQLQTKAEQYARLQAELESSIAAQNQAEQQLKVETEARARAQQELEARQRAEAEAAESLRKQSEAQAAPAQSATAVEPEIREQSHAVAQAELPEQAEPAMQVPVPQEPGSSDRRPPNTPVDWSSTDVSKHVRVYGAAAKAPADSQNEAEAPQMSEDEALLASLDPETAKAIKVMRRMGGDKKSVRELLEQYQAAQTNTKADSSKKSWFRRGK